MNLLEAFGIDKFEYNGELVSASVVEKIGEIYFLEGVDITQKIWEIGHIATSIENLIYLKEKAIANSSQAMRDFYSEMED